MATTNETKPDEEVITVSREEMQVIDDGNDEEDDGPQIHVRRVFIAPVGFPQPMPMMANLLSHIAMAAKLEQANKMNSNPKHVIIEEPVEPIEVSAIHDNGNANKQAISGGSASKTTFTFKPMKSTKSKHNTTKSTTNSKSMSAPETKSTEQSKSQNQSSSSSSVDASELIQNALSRCYTLLTALVALIMLVSFAVYRLYQEVVTYRNIKTSFIA